MKALPACLLLLPAALGAQVPIGAVTPPPLVYRGFAAGATFREFARQARTLAYRDTLVCQTSSRTARLMECGVSIRDPRDSTRYYLAAYLIDERVAQIALTDSGRSQLLTRTQTDLTRRFGRPDSVGRGMWQWRRGATVGRLTWRGRQDRRWISITLTDPTTMEQISRFVPPRR